MLIENYFYFIPPTTQSIMKLWKKEEDGERSLMPSSIPLKQLFDTFFRSHSRLKMTTDETVYHRPWAIVCTLYEIFYILYKVYNLPVCSDFIHKNKLILIKWWIWWISKYLNIWILNIWNGLTYKINKIIRMLKKSSRSGNVWLLYCQRSWFMEPISTWQADSGSMVA